MLLDVTNASNRQIPSAQCPMTTPRNFIRPARFGVRYRLLEVFAHNDKQTSIMNGINNRGTKFEDTAMKNSHKCTAVFIRDNTDRVLTTDAYSKVVCVA